MEVIKRCELIKSKSKTQVVTKENICLKSNVFLLFLPHNVASDHLQFDFLSFLNCDDTFLTLSHQNKKYIKGLVVILVHVFLFCRH